jgi:hypothetical protein
MALRASRWIEGVCLACLLICAGVSACSAEDDAAIPDAPQPQQPVQTTPAHPNPAPPKLPPVDPCDVRNAAATMVATAAVRASSIAENEPDALTQPARLVGVTLCVPHLAMISWYARFLNGPQVKAFTPLQKAHLAGRNLVDPFNLLTIAGVGAITVGSNSHSPYGPGMHGYANYIGVSFTQDMVGQFFGTFAIPSLTHQDPHYHRLPKASITRRAFHCVVQVVWTQGDNGKPMVNYANLVGFAASEGINNLYVPGQQTGLAASATRYGYDLATAPIDNFITEFMPDIARHIRVRIVLVQQIINQVARTETVAGQ